MSIPSAQLDTWSHQGATVISSNAYNSVRTALLKSTSPLVNLSLDIHLQGSYGNSTNIYGDSDVDVVVFYEDTFYKDMTTLTSMQQQLHEQTFPSAAYTWHNLRADVLTALRAHFGQSAVTEGSKAIKVKTSHGGMIVDVVPAVQFRKYAHFNNRNDLSAHWGMQFFDSAGNEVVNYPKYHKERGEEKNKQERTGGKYKPTVRV